MLLSLNFCMKSEPCPDLHFTPLPSLVTDLISPLRKWYASVSLCVSCLFSQSSTVSLHVPVSVSDFLCRHNCREICDNLFYFLDTKDEKRFIPYVILKNLFTDLVIATIITNQLLVCCVYMNIKGYTSTRPTGMPSARWRSCWTLLGGVGSSTWLKGHSLIRCWSWVCRSASSMRSLHLSWGSTMDRTSASLPS